MTEKWIYDCASDRGLTLAQKRVLLWLIMMCQGREKNIMCLYQRLGEAIGITKKAARVHIAALEKKELIVTSVLYRPGSRQPLGKRVAITKYAPPIKSLHLHQALSETERQKRREMQQGYNQTLEFWKNGGL